jgi:hypothetical protein
MNQQILGINTHFYTLVAYNLTKAIIFNIQNSGIFGTDNAIYARGNNPDMLAWKAEPISDSPNRW